MSTACPAAEEALHHFGREPSAADAQMSPLSSAAVAVQSFDISLLHPLQIDDAAAGRSRRASAASSAHHRQHRFANSRGPAGGHGMATMPTATSAGVVPSPNASMRSAPSAGLPAAAAAASAA